LQRKIPNGYTRPPTTPARLRLYGGGYIFINHDAASLKDVLAARARIRRKIKSLHKRNEDLLPGRGLV